MRDLCVLVIAALKSKVFKYPFVSGVFPYSERL